MAFSFMKRYCQRLLAFIKTLLRARKGRPVALAVLICFSVLNLCSEWPNDLALPSIVVNYGDFLTVLFG
jgi:adenylate cyclase